MVWAFVIVNYGMLLVLCLPVSETNARSVLLSTYLFLVSFTRISFLALIGLFIVSQFEETVLITPTGSEALTRVPPTPAL